MLELYHSINSVCAQKVRIALAEKGLTAKDQLMTVAFEQPEAVTIDPMRDSVIILVMQKTVRALRSFRIIL